jgi:hypothetical protein
VSDLPAQPDAQVNPIRQVVGWIVAGHAQPDIEDAIRQTWPDAKVRPLIVAALKQISKSGEPDRQLVIGFALEVTREILRKAMEVADHQTALRAVRQLVELSEK